jgi:hypothetical protein
MFEAGIDDPFTAGLLLEAAHRAGPATVARLA